MGRIQHMNRSRHVPRLDLDGFVCFKSIVNTNLVINSSSGPMHASGIDFWLRGRLLLEPVTLTRVKSSENSSSTLKRSEEHTSELQSHSDLVCRLLLEKKNTYHPARFTLLSSKIRSSFDYKCAFNCVSIRTTTLHLESLGTPGQPGNS